jgi:hypothetical protein
VPAPIVTDAPGFIDDQSIEADALQFDGRGNAGMAATDDENVRLAIVEADLGLPFVEPVPDPEITRMGFRCIFRSRVADFVKVESRRNRPGDGRSVRLIYQPDGSDAGPIDRVKANDRFDDLTAGQYRVAGSERRRIHPEFGCANLRSAMAQFTAKILVSA